jgi:uncharacterized repeat protein (TIGR01451 family)
MVNGTAPADIDRLVMVDAAAALVPCPALNIIRTIGVNPLLGSGAQGWSVSVTGSGFTSGNFASETLGGAAVTTNPSPIAAVSGGFGPVTITPSLPLANGAQSLVLNDGAANTFAGAISVVRTIGLDPVVGIGNAGATTLLRGTGFAAPTLLANTVTLSGNATTHAAATVTNGGFGPVTVTLPGLNGGAYDAFMQSDAFVGAYHVVNPAIQMTKYAQPRSGFRGDTVTYTFSFTNTLGAAEPPANGVAIIDTIPAGMRYVAGSPTSSLAATIDWFSSLCTCYTAVEPAPANVVAVRWTLSSPLPTGASGYAGFQVTVQ